MRKAGLTFEETVSAEEYDTVSKHPDLWHPRRGLRLVLDSMACCCDGHTSVSRAFRDRAARSWSGTLSAFFTSIRRSARVPAGDHPSGSFNLPVRLRTAGICSGARWLRLAAVVEAKRVVDHRSLHARSRHRPGAQSVATASSACPRSRACSSDWIHSPQRVIGLFPDWFGEPQPDWPAALRLTGFPLYDDSEQASLPASLTRFLDAGPPPLLFTPGSANQCGRTSSSGPRSMRARDSDDGRSCSLDTAASSNASIDGAP